MGGLGYGLFLYTEYGICILNKGFVIHDFLYSAPRDEFKVARPLHSDQRAAMLEGVTRGQLPEEFLNIDVVCAICRLVIEAAVS